MVSGEWVCERVRQEFHIREQRNTKQKRGFLQEETEVAEGKGFYAKYGNTRGFFNHGWIRMKSVQQKETKETKFFVMFKPDDKQDTNFTNLHERETVETVFEWFYVYGHPAEAGC
jgi:hypothetical protein